jgi:hypothetical protein
MAGEDSPETLGRIALKQVRVRRAEVEARNRETAGGRRPSNNPVNRLVPYLDLFCRLNDEELSRLARTPTSAVENLRQQVEEVNRALGRFSDLLPRLNDEELSRLTGATVKTVRFWRLSQPRHLQGEPRANPDTSSAPQSSSRRESSAVHRRSAEDSSESSSSSSSSTRRRRAEVSSSSGEDAAGDSATFVIDTIE